MSEQEAEALFRQAAAGEIDAETLGAKLSAMVETEAAAAEVETPEEEEAEEAEAEEIVPDDPIILALGEYLGKVQEIIGPDSPIQPCAYCHGMGFNPIELQPDPVAHVCEACNGFGETITGSKVTGNEARMCPECKGAGYIAPTPQLAVAPLTEEPAGVQMLSEAELAEVIRKAQEQAGANAA
jgi:hypothetical protein